MVATSRFILAASSVIRLSQGSPCGSDQYQSAAQLSTSTSTPTSAVSSASSTPSAVPSSSVEYKNYRGDGTVSQGWPDVSEWADFETLWTSNIALNPSACTGLSLEPNSDAENAVLKAAIKSTAAEANLDERFLLAAVWQESGACVRVATSKSPNMGYRNPGLLQCFNGNHTCNDVDEGVPILNPCPDDQIKGMLTDGAGLTTTDGLMQVVEKSGANDVSKYYKGALLYNSGVMPEDGNLGKGRSNACYSSDIANRLTGWIGNRSPCNKETIGDLNGN